MPLYLNEVRLIGNVGRDAELKTFANGGSIAEFSVATTESWGAKGSAERKEKTEWHNIVISGPAAESAAHSVKKGMRVQVVGSISTRKYTSGGVEKLAVEIRSLDYEILSKKFGDRSAGPGAESQGSAAAPGPRQSALTAMRMPASSPPPPNPADYDKKNDDDDIPF